MKGRLLVIASLVLLVFISAAFGMTMLRTGTDGAGPDRSGIITVDVTAMNVGGVVTKTDPIAALQGVRLPVYIVREGMTRYVAMLGRSPHLGCRLGWVGDPGYPRFSGAKSDAFEDPCGGAIFSIVGTCLGGPCSRGMDRFAITVSNGNARVDLNRLIASPPRMIP